MYGKFINILNDRIYQLVPKFWPSCLCLRLANEQSNSLSAMVWFLSTFLVDFHQFVPKFWLGCLFPRQRFRLSTKMTPFNAYQLASHGFHECLYFNIIVYLLPDWSKTSTFLVIFQQIGPKFWLGCLCPRQRFRLSITMTTCNACQWANLHASTSCAVL